MSQNLVAARAAMTSETISVEVANATRNNDIRNVIIFPRNRLALIKQGTTDTCRIKLSISPGRAARDGRIDLTGPATYIESDAEPRLDG
jgi:hypothetical protein